jgi:hypothetical protein
MDPVDELFENELMGLLLLSELLALGWKIHNSQPLREVIQAHASSGWRDRFRQGYPVPEWMWLGHVASDHAARFSNWLHSLAAPRWGWTTHDLGRDGIRLTQAGEAIAQLLRERFPEAAAEMRRVAFLADFDETEAGWRLLGERMGWTATQAAS